MSDNKFDTTVTEERIQRDDCGVIEEIKLKMTRGKSTYITVCTVADGQVSFKRVSPVQKYGGNISGRSFFGNRVKMMNVEKTLGVLDAAQEYIAENYEEIDGKRTLWLSRDGQRGNSDE